MLQPRRDKSDNHLLSLIDNGNEHALGALYDRHGRLIYILALRITGEQHHAEDVVQRVFSHVWKRQSRPATDCTVAAWLVEVTRFIILGGAVDRTHHPIPCDEASLAFGELTDEQRTALELAYYTSMTTNDIARRTGTKKEAVQAALREGLEHLRQLRAAKLAD